MTFFGGDYLKSKLIFKAFSTLNINFSVKWPILLSKRILSITRIWESKTTESNLRPAVPLERKTLVGYSLTNLVVVNSATIVVGEYQD